MVEDFVACGDDTFATAIDPAAASRAGDIVSFSGGGLALNGVSIEEVTSAGQTWWCVR